MGGWAEVDLGGKLGASGAESVREIGMRRSGIEEEEEEEEKRRLPSASM